MRVLLLLTALTAGLLACDALLPSRATPEVLRVQVTATPEVRIVTPTVEDDPGSVATPSAPAGSAGRVSILEAGLGAEVDRSAFELVQPREVFLPDEPVFVLLKLRSEAGERLTGRGVWIAPTGGVEWIAELNVPAGESSRILEGKPPPGGWLEGEHRIELYVGNGLVAAWEFEVEPECEICEEQAEAAGGAGHG